MSLFLGMISPLSFIVAWCCIPSGYTSASFRFLRQSFVTIIAYPFLMSSAKALVTIGRASSSSADF